MSAAKTAMPKSPLADFGAFIAKADSFDFDDEVYHHARRALIDYMAALLAGADKEPATNLVAALGDEIGVGVCTLIGQKGRDSQDGSILE